MILFRNARVSVAFVLFAACGVAVACADNNSDDPAVLDAEDSGSDVSEAVDDASTQIPEAQDADVDASDAEADARTFLDSGADAGRKKTCTVDNWCHTEVPSGQTLRGVWGDGTGIVWSVSSQGSILRWDGTSWSIVYTDTAGLFSIWGSSATDIWVGGKNGLFHGTGASSASLTWSKFAVDGNITVYSIWGSSTNDVWAVGNNDATVSRVLHYTGAPDDPATSGFAVDPVTLLTGTGKIVKVWGYSPSDVWVVGYGPGGTQNRYTKPYIFHMMPNDAGVPAFVKDDSFGSSFSNNNVLGGYTQDWNNVLWFGRYGGSPSALTNPYIYWGRRATSADPYKFTNAFALSVPQSSTSCSSQVHTGVIAFSINDVWKYGELGRLCHFDGTGWTLNAVSIEELPLANTFWDAWAPNGDSNQMWVVGDNVAIRKRAPQP